MPRYISGFLIAEVRSVKADYQFSSRYMPYLIGDCRDRIHSCGQPQARTATLKNDLKLILSTIRSLPPRSFSLPTPIFLFLLTTRQLKHGTTVRLLASSPYFDSLCPRSPETGMFMCDPVHPGIISPQLICL